MLIDASTATFLPKSVLISWSCNAQLENHGRYFIQLRVLVTYFDGCWSILHEQSSQSFNSHVEILVERECTEER